MSQVWAISKSPLQAHQSFNSEQTAHFHYNFGLSIWGKATALAGTARQDTYKQNNVLIFVHIVAHIDKLSKLNL